MGAKRLFDISSLLFRLVVLLFRERPDEMREGGEGFLRGNTDCEPKKFPSLCSDRFLSMFSFFILFFVLIVKLQLTGECINF